MKLARQAKRWTGRILTPLAEVLFPSVCWATDTPIAPEDLGLSTATRRQIARALSLPYCARCGMTTGPYTANSRKNPCINCARRNLGVTTIARVGTFDLPLSDLVKKLKFQKRWELAAVLAPFMAQAIGMQAQALGLRVDALVPVPLHFRRRSARGFNQAEELALATSRLMGHPMVHALVRTRATHEQSLTLSPAQRRSNLENAFRVRARADVAGQHIWLIDDVCTTGSTLHAAALPFKHLAKDRRPARIHAAVLCVTDHTPAPSPS